MHATKNHKKRRSKSNVDMQEIYLGNIKNHVFYVLNAESNATIFWNNIKNFFVWLWTTLKQLFNKLFFKNRTTPTSSDSLTENVS